MSDRVYFIAGMGRSDEEVVLAVDTSVVPPLHSTFVIDKTGKRSVWTCGVARYVSHGNGMRVEIPVTRQSDD